MLNWDDMRVFIAVAQSGSFSAAGRRIGMDATTVARRIERLEASLKATLIVRHRQGLQLTAAGANLAGAGASVEAAVDNARAQGAHDPLAGTIRISVAEGFGVQLFAPALPNFMDKHPGILVEVDASPGYLSPATRKVDLSITSSPPTSSRLIIERLTDYELGLYASPKYLKKRRVPQVVEDLREHNFVGWVDDLIYSDQLQFLDAFKPNLARRLKCSSIKVQIVLAEGGGGIGAFPHFLVADNPNLVPILPNLIALRTYWMATHSELYEIARVRAVRSWLFALAKENRELLTPHGARSGVAA